ncbi:MAG: hypothetical protein ACSLFQ_02335 [Thermoanaerobaculia bacterium]
MKQKVLISLALGTLLVASFGCKKAEYTTETGAEQPPQVATTQEIAGTTNPNDLNPMTAQSYIDDVKVGNALGTDGLIGIDKTTDMFTAGQPIYLTMTVNDAPATAAVKVVWYGPNDTKITEESKSIAVGAKTLSFEAPSTSSWAIGGYHAEVWIGDEKVKSEDFKIVDRINT